MNSPSRCLGTRVVCFQTAAKKRKEKEKIHVIIDKLDEELAKQKEHVERVRARLDIERECWFNNRTFISSARVASPPASLI